LRARQAVKRRTATGQPHIPLWMNQGLQIVYFEVDTIGNVRHLHAGLDARDPSFTGDLGGVRLLGVRGPARSSTRPTAAHDALGLAAAKASLMRAGIWRKRFRTGF
jgi:hypothetical protein